MLYKSRNIAYHVIKESGFNPHFRKRIIKTIISCSRSDMIRGDIIGNDGERTGIDRINISDYLSLLKYSPIDEVDLSNIGISWTGAEILIKTLIKSPNLTKINLDGNPQITGSQRASIAFVTSINLRCKNLEIQTNTMVDKDFLRLCQLISNDYSSGEIANPSFVEKMLKKRYKKARIAIDDSEFDEMQGNELKVLLKNEYDERMHMLSNCFMDQNPSSRLSFSGNLDKKFYGLGVDHEEFYCSRVVHLYIRKNYRALVSIIYNKTCDYFDEKAFRDASIEMGFDPADRSLIRALSPLLNHFENSNKLENLQNLEDNLSKIKDTGDYTLERFIKFDLGVIINKEINKTKIASRKFELPSTQLQPEFEGLKVQKLSHDQLLRN